MNIAAPPSRGRRDRVHVAIADLGHRADPHRKPADDGRHEVGDGRRDQQRDQVLAHVTPSGGGGVDLDALLYGSGRQDSTGCVLDSGTISRKPFES